MFQSAIKAVDNNVIVTCVSDGMEAENNILRKNPDIVIVDAEIQGPDLLDLLSLIMLDAPKTFVLVTARPSSTSAKVFMEALSAGASDSMTKPIYDSYSDNLETIKNRMVEIIEIQKTGNTTTNKIEDIGNNVSNIKKFQEIEPKKANMSNARELNIENKNKTGKSSSAGIKVKKSFSTKHFRPQIILIAVSTGGPRALEKIIPALRPDITVPILIVQHMPPHFIETLVQRLSSKSKLKVKVAENGEYIKGGVVYLAPGGVHMRLNADNEVYLDDSPPLNGVRPAADALFESIAEDFAGLRVLTVVLTGMGQDSLRGIKKLKDKKKCYCIAQSEKTCVVYGMPRVVIEEGLADKVLDLEEIAPEIEGFNYI